jgi:hypothetical protein
MSSNYCEGASRETGNWRVEDAGRLRNPCRNRVPRERVLRRCFGSESQATDQEARSAIVRAPGRRVFEAHTPWFRQQNCLLGR